MRRLITLPLKLRALFSRTQIEQDLEDEIRFHIEGKTAEGIARGLTETEARRAAHLAMDGLDRRKEECRDARGVRIIEETARAVRFAFRGLRRNPTFTATAVMTLALGIGASTAVFTLIDVALLKPLPWRDPERLAIVSQNMTFGANNLLDRAPVSAAHSRAWEENGRSLDGVALLRQQARFVNAPGGEPQRVYQTRVTPNLFNLLGIAPAHGRGFLDTETQPGQDAVVILSHHYWRDRMNADPAAIGKKLVVDGRPHEIIGLMPPTVYFPKNSELNYWFPLSPSIDIWSPLALDKGQYNPTAEFNHFAIARLAAAASIESARADLSLISQSLVAAANSPIKASVNLVPISEAMQAGVRDSLTLLAAAVFAVLLICCVNAANLLFTRALGRRNEQSVRVSLGAGRARLLGEMLVESALLAAAGGAVGVLAAYWLIQAYVFLPSAGIPRLEEVAINFRVLAFSIAITAGAALCAAAVPAWRFSNVDPKKGLRSNREGVGDPSARLLRGFLIAAQVALCVILLVAAGLLARSFAELAHVDKGFDPRNVVTVSVELPPGKYANAAHRRTAFQDLFSRLQNIPGIPVAGGINYLPMRDESYIFGILPEGESGTHQLTANYRIATPGYFAAAGIPLHAGRLFNDTDTDLDAAVISRNAAQRLWPGKDPVGRRFRRAAGDEWIRVVGVVNDIRQSRLDRDPPLIVYRPHSGDSRLFLTARTTLPVASAADAIRSAIRQFDSASRLGPIQTMEELVAATTARRRLQTGIVIVFALIALVLASLGVFGAVSYATAQRRAEIGLRLALGATPRKVVALVMRQGLAPVSTGALIGAAGAFAAARAMKSMLFGITPIDTPSFLGSVTLLAVVAALACAIPALRASHIDPQQSLRVD
jgi:predicted permease